METPCQKAQKGDFAEADMGEVQEVWLDLSVL